MNAARRLLSSSSSAKPASTTKMAPIPIALCGKSSSMAGTFSQSMLPEYEIVHHFQSADAARNELPKLFRGEHIKPSSGMGSNNDSDDIKVPRAVVVGAGFSRDELDEMRKIEGADSVPWLYPDPIKSAGSILTGPFLMTVIVKRAKSCLQTNGVAEGKEPGDTGVWPF